MSKALLGSAFVVLALMAATLVRADRPGQFDYYVLALSWSPQYCASEARPGDLQCARPYAFVVHGLWPQHERGWPRDCGRGEYLQDALIRKVLPFMPSKPLVLHQWRKHGVCSGLSSEAYFALTERAYRSISIPAAYHRPETMLKRNVQSLEQDFVAANPMLRSEGIAVQCSNRYLREVQVCLTRELQPRSCGVDVRDRCRGEFVLRPWRSASNSQP